MSVTVEASADELATIIGMMSVGADPVATASPEEMADYTILGRLMIEVVQLRRRNDEVTAGLTVMQTKLASSLQIAESTPLAAEAPPPDHPNETEPTRIYRGVEGCPDCVAHAAEARG